MSKGPDAYPAIIGIGAALPERAVTNDQLIAATGITSTHEWIAGRTGIEQRRWVEDGEYASDLAIRAARCALKTAGLSPDGIANLFLSTATPDYPTPSTSSIVHGGLGLPERCLAIDLNAACAGSMIGLSLAANTVMAQPGSQSSLVIGAEITSRGLNLTDRRSVILFGDGAGAAVVAPVAGARRPYFVHMTQPNFGALNVPAGGLVKVPYGPDDPEGKIHMDGQAVALHAIDIMTRGPQRVAEEAGVADENGKIDWGSIDYFVPHHGNGVLVDAVAEILEAPGEKVVKHIAKFGNTSSASILIALNEAYRQGQVGPGLHRVLFTAVGAGFVGGAALMDVALR